ncbi:hypothetical protein GCM10007103_17060 [Salinimicrobium marinum]|uniref:Adhesin domain-containing protein n=2 Tax=Salinimicrobium marinum TaxID=680283 RepID=A0A918SDV5_9FLAO|nr:hypothetical protein GCM10007103_17060 [Salinimicrobium marinum]
MDAKEITGIIIRSDEVFKIRISTAPVETIIIKTRADGEYFNNISLDAEVSGETLLLTSRFREILQSGFDKLSAHKVFAMEVELEVPEGLSVEIISNLASVLAKGVYERLFVQLKSGYCNLQEFNGDAVVNTFDGNVEVETSNALVKASSRHGTVNTDINAGGQHTIQITSINGNISVTKTK